MSDCLEATSWAVTEFADADLGDLRRTQRLVQLAHALAQRPGAACPKPVAAARGSKPPIAFSPTMTLPLMILSRVLLRRPIVVSTPCPSSWLYKIRPKPTGRIYARPKAWDRWDTPHVTACWSIPRWPSRRSGARWGSWPNRSGPGPRTTGGNGPGARSSPAARRKVKSGSTVSTPSPPRAPAVPRPTCSASAIGKPMCRMSWRLPARRASIC